MILKFNEYSKINLKNNFILFYGKNEELKKIAIKNIIENEETIFNYEEKELIENPSNLIDKILNKSLFEEKKIFIIRRVSDKFIDIVEQLKPNKIEDKIILISETLEKKSKLRNLFEKDKQLVCIPFYPDNEKTLFRVANDFMKMKKISIAPENINFLIRQSGNDRKTLIDNLSKVELYCKSGKKINSEALIKLTNLIEDHSITELADQFLCRNKKKLIQILNENNFSNEDCIIVIRILLNKSKKLLDLLNNFEKNNNINTTISTAKPAIFWKDKEIVKEQILKWSKTDLKRHMYTINSLELEVKKNFHKPLNIVLNFLLDNSKFKTNN